MQNEKIFPPDAELTDIDTETVHRDYKAIPEEVLPKELWGQNVRYWRDINGTMFYLFRAQGDEAMGNYPTHEGLACGNNGWQLPWSLYDHHNTGRHCSGGSGPAFEKVKFTHR